MFFNQESFSLFLSRRKSNVEAELEHEGVRMEPLRKLVLHLNRFTEDRLEECRSLVGEVVDWASEPDYWEVEI